MKHLIVSAFNFFLKRSISRNTNITIDKDSRVRWWALRATRGGFIEIGSACIVNCVIAFDSPKGRVIIGKNSYIGSSTLVCHTEISIGDDVIISWGVTIVDHDSHTLDWRGRSSDVKDWIRGDKSWGLINIRPVKISNKVWIGFGATVLKGVSIGEGAVIAAQAVVTRDVPPYTLVAGNPARVVRELAKD